MTLGGRSTLLAALAIVLAWTATPIGAEELCRETSPAAAGLFRTIAPGLDYRHDQRQDGPLSIHVLRIDLARQSWSLHAGLGQGEVFGLEPLDGIVGRTAAAHRRPAMAAINGDFFVIKPGPYQGDPRGIQITHGELVSRPSGNCFWVAPNGEPKLGIVASKLRVVWPDGRTETPVGLNEARADDAAVLYTPLLGLRPGEMPHPPRGTRTDGGREIVLAGVPCREWLPLAVGKICPARVQEVHEGGNTPLAPQRIILSLGPKLAPTLPAVKPGDTLRLATQTEPDLCGVRTAIGVGRILIQNGKLPDLGPADQPRHPRSLIGWNRRYLIFAVVDGRQPKLSIGMTYPEMAALAEQYGCTDAVELDGGGSSTLWAMGRILNSPSDGSPRPIANSLVVFGREDAEPICSAPAAGGLQSTRTSPLLRGQRRTAGRRPTPDRAG